MPNGGLLLIETENVELDEKDSDRGMELKPGPYVRLCVSDTGAGMTEEVKSRLFEPFFTTKKSGEGTGLGLSMVYGIVKQSGGAISVHSESGNGTTFTIYLPRIQGWASPTPYPVIPPVRHGTETILVLEDNDLLRRMVVEILEERGSQFWKPRARPKPSCISSVIKAQFTSS